uniref:Kinase family protein n=1 Tax=Tetraselmis sp. GSL018 TaxID=582737 RepID=A0A061RLX5_9CHLO
MEKDDDLENFLSGYSDTLEFILEFLRSEGFQTTERALLTEIEERLPSLLEQRMASQVSEANHEAPQSPYSTMSDPGLFEACTGSLEGDGADQARQARSVDRDSADPQRGSLPSRGELFPQGEVHREECLGAASGSLHSESRLDPDPPPCREEVQGHGWTACRGVTDEYSDDEDVGYVRIDVHDQQSFVEKELDLPSAPGSDLRSPSASNSGSSERNAKSDPPDHHRDGDREAGSGQAVSSRSASSRSSSAISSYFSGEPSPQLSGRTTALSAGNELQTETQKAKLKICKSPPLPPADADQEVMVMGLETGLPELQRLQPAGQGRRSGATAEPPEAGLSGAPSPGQGGRRVQGDGDGSALDRSPCSEPEGNSVQREEVAGTSDEPTRGDHQGAQNTLDFAFPVTPTSDDPSAVFNTWTTLRSRSISNASDYSGFDQLPADAAAASQQLGASAKIDEKEPGPNPVPARSYGQAEAAQQVLDVLQALEIAQASSNAAAKERFGSLGSIASRGSFGGGGGGAASPPSSLPEMAQLWEEEGEAEEEPVDALEASHADELHILYPEDDPGGGAPEEDEAEEGERAASEGEEASRSGSSRDSRGGLGSGEPEAANASAEPVGRTDDMVMEYDPEEVEKRYEIFSLPIIHRRRHTGFEETKDFPIRINDCVAGRYQILDYLGSAAFSRAVQALDLKTGMLVCLKIIKNNKDYFDQSLDEIKLLQYVNQADPADSSGVLRMYDYFYYKEHLFIVCELLRANLYEFQKYNRESGDDLYFNLPRLQAIAQQVLKGLSFLHGLGLIHSDLKPENILIKSYSRCEVKVIDLGSSCFTTDHLSSYVQSRSYRAPEVILGMKYDQRIDIWSLGCILAELASGYVLFQNVSLATLLARMVGILGDIPEHMLKGSRYAPQYFTRSGYLYEKSASTGQYQILRPKVSSLERRVPQGDEGFLDFLSTLLRIDPEERPTAEAALQHPWLEKHYPET